MDHWTSHACHANARSMCNMQPQREIRRWTPWFTAKLSGILPRRGRNWPPRGSRLIEARPFFSFLPASSPLLSWKRQPLRGNANRLWPENYAIKLANSGLMEASSRTAVVSSGRGKIPNLRSRVVKNRIPRNYLSKPSCLHLLFFIHPIPIYCLYR